MLGLLLLLVAGRMPVGSNRAFGNTLTGAGWSSGSLSEKAGVQLAQPTLRWHALLNCGRS